MGGGRKRRRRDGSDVPTIHPRNRYAAAAPDFAGLASLYPSFAPFVSVSRGRASVDFTEFNATRELTRVLLLHDHGLNWWIPDGQLCPTVPNRSNYIHWINDLLSSDLIPPISSSSEKAGALLDLGLRREYGALQVLKSAEDFFRASNLSCKTDSLSFSINVTLSYDQTQAAMLHGDDTSGSVEDNSSKLNNTVTGTSFRISVFEQVPGTLLIRGSVLNRILSGAFSSLFTQLEDTLRTEFLSKSR